MKVETYALQTNKNVTLTTYLLDDSPEFTNIDKRPAILIFPGGGYQFISDREAEPIAMKYAAEGYHTFVLHYTVGKEHHFEMALENAKEAMKMIRNNTDEWHVSIDQIAVIGFSAGGHLAASLSVLGDSEERPNALLLGYPCITDTMNDILAFPVPSIDKEVNEKTPSTFLFTTFEDKLVPVANSLAFIDALHKMHIPFEAHIFQHGGHGLSLATTLTSAGFKASVNDQFAQWFSLSIGWLQRIFGDFTANKETLDNTSINAYSISVPLSVLFKNAMCRDIILTHLPKIEEHEQFEQMKDHSLHVLNDFLPKPFSEKQLEAINEKLLAVPFEDNN